MTAPQVAMIIMQVQLPQLYTASDVRHSTRLRLKGFRCKMHSVFMRSPFIVAAKQVREKEKMGPWV